MEYLKRMYLESIGIDYLPRGMPPSIEQGSDAGSGFATLQGLRDEIGDCRRCPLSQDRHHIVFGVGNPDADLVFVGEAPERDEDEQGEPFVGKAGQLLTKIISAMGLSRGDVYICNVIKCRPPDNRDPLPAEIEMCEPFLKEQLRIINPRAICALGSFASRTLLKREVKISRLRGQFHAYNGVPLMPTYHPSYLLRNPQAKRDVWEDIKIVMELLDLPLPRRDNS
ncbi:MAG: uracil-DNA glycosylase [bacterium]|nr:uracil-DNA glycosylase [bacterium]